MWQSLYSRVPSFSLVFIGQLACTRRGQCDMFLPVRRSNPSRQGILSQSLNVANHAGRLVRHGRKQSIETLEAGLVYHSHV